MFIRDRGLQHSFLVMFLSGFLYEDNTGLIERIGECFLCFYFLKQIVESWYLFYLKYLVEFTSNPSGPGANKHVKRCLTSYVIRQLKI